METVGIEPTSESRPPPVSPCSVLVLDWAADVQEQTAATLHRLWFRFSPTSEKTQASLLNDALSVPTGEAQESVVLNGLD